MAETTWEAVAASTSWLDNSNGTGDHELTCRILKVTEEAGEAAAAWIGALGRNPRKGVTHTREQTAAELADVVISSLVAIASLGFDPQEVVDECARKVLGRLEPPRALGRHDPATGDGSRRSDRPWRPCEWRRRSRVGCVPNQDWLPPQQYYASIPKNMGAAGALFTDPAGRVLIVKPNYRDFWLTVGGVMDEGETPEQTCRREVAEEIGIDQPVGRLLLVDWSPPSPIRPLPLVKFIFDGGVIEPERVRLGDDELDEFRWLSVEQALPLLSGDGRRRLTEALEARRTGTVRYRSDGG